jgi:ribosomal protein S18 acetylase RimI-like enzyme
MPNSSSASIRPREDADLPELGELVMRVHQSDEYPVERVADPIAWLESDRFLGAWVAELAGNVVGHVALTSPAPNYEAANIWISEARVSRDSVAVLGRLFVSSEARGRHLGRRLTIIATRYAELLGRRAVLDVMAKDTSAVRVYEDLGWRKLAAITHRFQGNRTEPAFAYVSPEAIELV